MFSNTTLTPSVTETGTDAGGNVVDRAAESADQVIKATQRAADAALAKVSDKIHSLRDSASPVADRIAAPFDAASAYTQEAPLKSLLIAAAAGAVLMAGVSLLTRATRRTRA